MQYPDALGARDHLGEQLELLAGQFGRRGKPCDIAARPSQTGNHTAGDQVRAGAAAALAEIDMPALSLLQAAWRRHQAQAQGVDWQRDTGHAN